MNRTELEELLGAYALDALEPDERADVEAFLVHEPDLALEAAHRYLDASDFVPPTGTEDDHWAMTRPTIERLLAGPRQAIIDALAGVNDRIVAALPVREAELGSVSDLTSEAALVRAKVFEMW